MTSAEPSLSEYFTRDHRDCDSRWADVERAAEAGEGLAQVWARFAEGLRLHLAREEEVLFPAFEEATGMKGGGPTTVMRSEHAQMRGVMDQMGEAVQRGDARELLDQGDTLLMLIQQHNQKEEAVLYPLAEQSLGASWAELRSEIESRS